MTCRVKAIIRHDLPAAFALVAAALLLAFAAPAQAQNSDFLAALGSSAGGNVIDVEINKGRPVRLSQPAASVAIANPAIADVQVVSPRLLFVNGVSVGETSIIVVDANDTVIYETSVNVSHNLSRFNRAVAEMAPGDAVVAESTDNAIILSGKVDSPVLAEKLQRLATSFLSGDRQSVINMIDTSASDQVMLKVKIVEVSRAELKRFGINWESVLSGGNFLFGLAQGRDLINADGVLTRSTGGDGSLSAGFNDGSTNINAVIDALEEDGLVSVLAEPNLTTRSGMPASFLAGGEFPVPVPGEEDAVTIEYRQFGVSLQFTPIVLSKNKISLTVLPEVSSLSSENAITGGAFGDIPSLTTRRASTTVDLGTGQTFAIAGLLRNDQASSVSKFPGLGDLPVIGALFRSTEFQNNQTELVILVTPYIVKPVSDPTRFATPLDGYTPPTDAERILLGKIHGTEERKVTSAKPDNSPGAVFSGIGGQAGFLMR